METSDWAAQLWAFFPLGYLISIALETPVLLIGLSGQHSITRRIWCGVWLTACTYPMVVLVFPVLIWPTFGHTVYTIVAEVFAPLAECLLFRAAARTEAGTTAATRRDYVVIVVANLTSFLVGLWIVG